MPRKPTTAHVLRDLRTCIGKTQESLAQLVGCSAVTIRKVEGGTLNPGDQLSRRIALCTGINREEILKGARGKLIDHFGRPYTPETFVWWRSRATKVGEGHGKILGERLGYWIGIMLTAAERMQGGNRFAVAADYVIENVQRACDELGLQSHVRSVMDEAGASGKFDPRSLTPAELKSIQDDEIAFSREALKSESPQFWLARQSAFLSESEPKQHSSPKRLKAKLAGSKSKRQPPKV